MAAKRRKKSNRISKGNAVLTKNEVNRILKVMSSHDAVTAQMKQIASSLRKKRKMRIWTP